MGTRRIRKWKLEGPCMLFAVPTGAKIPDIYERADLLKFVGTVFLPSGLVFHVFDGGEVL